MSRAALHIILNPTSRSGQAGRRQREVAHELERRGCTAIVHRTTAAGHARELARELASAGTDIVVAAGGDGTIHDVANGILAAGTTTVLGILPMGTGNDFVKVVPGTRGNEAYDTLIARRTMSVDVGHVSWEGGSEFFVNGMGTGIDVEVVRQLQRVLKLPAPLRYLSALLRALGRYEPVRLRAALDGEQIECAVMMMAVGNGVCQGGGFYLTPGARPDDGRLDLCVIAELPLRRVPPLLLRVLRGTHAGHPLVSMRRIERVRFESPGPALYFQLDGELREPPRATWLAVEVRRAALRVVAATEPNG